MIAISWAMTQRASSSSGRSFSADVLSRILSVLHREGETRKTNLAGKTRLNYLTCMKYLDLLRSLGLIELRRDDKDAGGGQRVLINGAGKQFNASLSAYLQGNDNNGSNSGATENKYYVDRNKNYQQSAKQTDTRDNLSPDTHGRIMLVDDEKDILFTYKLFLTEHGYDAEVFSNPAEAFQRIALSPSAYELVVTDIRMSSLNGLQLYHGIRALNPNIKIIFLSALDATDELVSVLPALNKDFVLKKPVNREVFMKTIDLALQNGDGGSANSVSPLLRS